MAMTGMGDTASFIRTIAYDGIVRWDPDFKTVIPNIAKDWKVSDDARVYTLYLREGMRWSDGHPFTAEDIMYWFEEVQLNTDLTPVFPTWLAPGGNRPTVTKIDEYTVEFKYARPHGLLLRQFANAGQGYIFAPKHYMKQFHPKYTSADRLEALTIEHGLEQWYQLYQNMDDRFQNPERPTLDAWKTVTPLGKSTQVVLERNPYYWKIDPEGNQLPYIDKVIYAVVENVEVALMKALSGEIDMQDRHIGTLRNFSVVAENREKGGYRIYRTKPTGENSMVICFNLNHKDPVMNEIFNDKRFRIAMSHAINRPEIIDLIYYGEAEPSQPAPRKESPFYYEPLTNAFIEYDVAEANRLLDEMGLTARGKDGFRLRPDGKPLTVTIELAPLYSEIVDASELLKVYWEAVGVRVAVKVQERSLFYTRTEAADHDVALHHADSSGIDVLLYPRYYFPSDHQSMQAPLWSLWYRSGGKSGEKPPKEVLRQMELYDQILATADEARQVELMTEILKINAENSYVLGISTMIGPFGIVKDNFHNVPDEIHYGWIYPSPAPTRAEQYYISDK
ncbi:MAG: ABC transporter substrate-binding protein [Firmicutes bacterium]|nr:ABC transporter substrate-binding protein [Bacillota bacterium]